MDMLVSTFDNKKITVLNTCIEVNAVAIKVLLQILYQDVRLLSFQPTTGMVLQQVTFETNKVTAQGQIIGIQLPHMNQEKDPEIDQNQQIYQHISIIEQSRKFEKKKKS